MRNDIHDKLVHSKPCLKWPLKKNTKIGLCFFCLVFVLSLCASVYLCLVVTSWERADLFALVCDV